MSDYQRYPVDQSVAREKQLGQSRPANTTAASIYSPASNVTGIIRSVVICNTTTSAAAYRIFVDDDGTTYDQTTAVFYDAPIAANTTVIVDTYWPMNNSSGNIAVRTDTASALTFTVFGEEITRTIDNL